MTERINGFLILRRSLEDTKPYGSIFRLGSKEYRGMGRPDMRDLVEDDYGTKLPGELQLIIKKVREQSHDLLFIDLIKEYRDAVKIFEYANKKSSLYELTVIDSAVLTESRGAIAFDTKRIEWLGFDVYGFGGASLILDGLFFKPDYFRKWPEIINENGLFPTKDGIDEFIRDYSDVAKQDIVEDYNVSNCTIDAVRVGKIKLISNRESVDDKDENLSTIP